MLHSYTSALRAMNCRRRTRCLAAMLLMLSIPLFHAAGQDISVDIRTQITIFQTLLTFERTDRTDSIGDIRAAIVYQSKFRKSVVARDEIVAQLLNGKNQSVSPQVIDIDLDAVDPEEIISKRIVSVLLICPLRSFGIRTITELSRKHGILSMTVVPDYVTKGIAIGIDVKDAKPQILLNRTAAKLENADFDSRMFKFVKIIGNGD